MTEKLNHHFVPQFYFRFFSLNGRSIHLARICDGRVIRDASIRGQCARRRFYGSREVEDALCTVESKHAHVLSQLTAYAWDRTVPQLSVD
jgi:hypothetical protein